MNGRKTISIQDKYVYLILREIQKRGSSYMRQLRGFGSWRTLDLRLRFMSDNGLIVSFVNDKDRRVNQYRLTDKGYSLLLLLDMGENIINGRADIVTGGLMEKIEELTLETPTEAYLRRYSESTAAPCSRYRNRNQ